MLICACTYSVAAYYGDLGDGVHTGKDDDPRISIIEVIPTEIRYWVATSGQLGRAINVAVGAVTGKGSAPGELRMLTSAEVSELDYGAYMRIFTD